MSGVGVLEYDESESALESRQTVKFNLMYLFTCS